MIADCTEAIRISPKYALAFNERGFAYAAIGDYDRAIADYDEALRLDPKLSVAGNNRNTAAAEKAAARQAASFDEKMNVYGDATTKAETDEPLDVCGSGGEKSIKACTEIINDTGWSVPLRAAILINRAEEYGTAGKYDLAVRDLDQAIQMLPKASTVVAYNFRGQTYGMMGNYDLAIGDFTQAIQSDPSYAAAYYNRGQTYLAKGSHDLAIKDFDQAINLNPNYALAYAKRGNAYAAKKDYGRALADYSDAARVSPEYAEAYNARGTVYALRGDHDRALSDYSKAISLNPSSPDFYLSRAMLAARHSDFNLEIADLNEAIRLNPRRPDLYLWRGKASIEAGDETRGQQDLDKAIALDLDNVANAAVMSLSLKGLIAYFRGDLAGATKDYDEAVRLSPKQASFHEWRGLTLAARGELGRAIQDYTQAITLQPEETSAYFARGLAYFSQGDFGLAATDFARLKDNPNDARGLLWYYLASGRAGSTEGRQESARMAAQRKSDAWPTPIFQLMQGQRAADSVLAAAGNPQQRCEAQFYTAEWHLLKGAPAAAADGFNAAVKTCALMSIEHRLAIEELRRIGDRHESR